jgi:predicted transcriptional regulator
MALVQTGVRVPDELFREVKILAAKTGVQLQEIFTRALRDYLAKQSGE